MTLIIYKVTNIINGKVYIGQTCNTLDYRRSQHERDCKYHRNSYFHEALLKYGFDNFVWEIIDSSDTQEGIDELEKMYIKEYKTTDKKYGYNLKLGGREGGMYNDDCRKRLGESTKKKWQNPKMAAKMLEGLRKGTETVKERAKNYWEIRICPHCGKEFKVKPHEKKRFCSYECSVHGCKDKILENQQKATTTSHEINVKIRNERKEIILNWAKNNKDLILNCPFNKVETTFKELFDILNVKDMKTISACVGGKYRKDFLRILQEYVNRL